MFWIYGAMGCLCLVVGIASAQSVQRQQASLQPVGTDPTDSTVKGVKREPDLVNVLVLDFFTTLNAIQYENVIESSQVPQLNANYNWSVNNLARTKRFSIRTFIYNEYGFRHFFDSLTVKTEDNFRLRNNIQITPGKKLMLQCGIDQRTQLWKKWGYRRDSSMIERRYLYSDYSSPGYTIYSMGLGVNFMEGAAVCLGLVGGKITRIRNQRIFDERGVNSLYGIKKGERRKVEWGMNLLLSIPPQLLTKSFGWELSGTVFVPRNAIGRMKSYTAETNNVFHYMFLKHMRISLRTHLQYDEAVQVKIFMANYLSVGFYLSNRL